MEIQPIIIERTFNVPISRIWKAISYKSEMKHWYFNLKEFKPEVGFKFQFTGGPDDEKQYVHLCEVTASDPKKLLSYTWTYEGYTGASEVVFELIDQVDQTLLKLSHYGLNSFPKDNPDLAVHNFVQGWNHIIHTSLRAYLEDEVKSP